MLRRIYHGSDHVIERPVFGKGKPYNDYGRGFYCTENLDLAKEWGVGIDRDGFANCYDIDCDGMDILNLNSECYCILHWLAVLLENRTFDVSTPLAHEARDYLLSRFLPDYQNRDVIIGYRADDSYFAFAQDFVNGGISLRQLNNAMHLGKLGEQFVMKSERAFSALRFVGYERAASSEYFARRAQRDRAARRGYFDVERNQRRAGDLFIIQIIDEGMDGDDARLRRNLS